MSLPFVPSYMLFEMPCMYKEGKLWGKRQLSIFKVNEDKLYQTIKLNKVLYILTNKIVIKKRMGLGKKRLT